MIRINKTGNVFNAYNKNMNVNKNEKKEEREDRLELSKEAKDYQFAMEKIKALPDTRMDKIETIKAQVQAGTYKVDSKKIAEKILENVEMHNMNNRWRK